jgi:hypothetical protein
LTDLGESPLKIEEQNSLIIQKDKND